MSTIEKAFNKNSSDGNGDNADRHARAALESKHGIEIDLQLMHEKGMLVPSSGRTTIAEEYRQIKRPLIKNIINQSANLGCEANLIMITSALPGEGKTFTAVNLAMSIAMELDHTCLLIDSDVAYPFLLPRGKRKGLVDYLTDKSLELSDLMLRTNVPKLSILPVGQGENYATELLASGGMRDLAKELSERYHDRIIIFDSPPLLATTESRVLATLVGQVVVVVEALRTQQSAVKQAVEYLDHDKFISFILNKSRATAGHGYYYGYGKGYGYGDKENDK